MGQKADIQEIVIDGKTYVPKETQKEPEGTIKIVVLQRGWISVGYFERNGSDCKLHHSHTIRKWGTTQGLGELAKNGPLPNTVLDKENGLVEFDYLTVIKTISCEELKWKSAL